MSHEPVWSPLPNRRSVLRGMGVAALAAGFVPTGADAQAGSAVRPVPPDAVGLRPPATPLVVRAPYLNTWLTGDDLAGSWSRFWTGAVTALCGIAVVDGESFVFAGQPGFAEAKRMRQADFSLTSTESIFTMEGAGVALTVTFLSPVDLEDFRRQSVPASYVVVTARSVDGRAHQVSVYLDISAEWAHGDQSSPVGWARHDLAGANPLTALTFTPASPEPLTERHDQASWGTVVWAADARPGLTWQIGADTVVRRQGMTGGLANQVDARMPRAINDAWPVAGFRQDLGVVRPHEPSQELVLLLGHVRTPAVRYQGADLPPLWSAYWGDWPEMLAWFRADLPAARRRCASLDERIVAEATAVGGPAYARLCRLALRQAVAGAELVRGDGAVWAFQKEISSGAFMSTVDVLYPAAPVYLHLGPAHLKALLLPVIDYARTGWTKPYAPHDLGLYPRADGQAYGSGDMPVEESANLLVMAAALVGRLPDEEIRRFVTREYPVFRQWAEYLVDHALDPGLQNHTDDFTGPIAHSVNLALKGITGLGAMSRLAAAVGEEADELRYRATAFRYITLWADRARDDAEDHLKLAYDRPGTWSLKYNAYADRLLRLGLVPHRVAAQEANWYLRSAARYGIPLDVRHHYTKNDWELWCAAWLVDRQDVRQLIVERVHDYAHQTPSRVPLSDWHDTDSAVNKGFQARPVVGGFFAPLTVDNQRTPSAPTTGHGPAVAQDVVGKLTFVTTTSSGRLVHGWQSRPGQGPWERAELIDGVVGDASSLLDVNGKLTYFVRTRSGELVWGWQESPGRGPWRSEIIARDIAGSPAAALDIAGKLTVVATTVSGRLAHGWQSRPGEGPWEWTELVDGVVGDAASLLDVNGKLTCFVRSRDGDLVWGWQESPGRGPWRFEAIARDVAGIPSAALDVSGKLTYFVRTRDDHLLHGWQTNPGRTTWDSARLTPMAHGDPASTLDSSGHLVVLTRHRNDELLCGRQERPGQGPWRFAVLATNVDGNPAAITDPGGKLTFFVRAKDGHLLHGWQTSAGGDRWDTTTLGSLGAPNSHPARGTS
ncbi:glutaminase domain-containing protein [Streptoalloteichus hindustanus]|uniref:Uncharacterized protein n=1 Tax=Streptoalloteichus hindustanus TaxID=2017 RepID=A0A1M4ZAT2_STRHI|nr:DUF5127 domain-containing protein [Streptoalloteichus hindustanus]SHF15068.1 protein of unknown function [Streptoalloteichus hindustanus]